MNLFQYILFIVKARHQKTMYNVPDLTSDSFARNKINSGSQLPPPYQPATSSIGQPHNQTNVNNQTSSQSVNQLNSASIHARLTQQVYKSLSSRNITHISIIRYTLQSSFHFSFHSTFTVHYIKNGQYCMSKK